MNRKRGRPALCAGVAAFICLLAAALFGSGVLVLDHTAEETGDGFVWKGTRYVFCSADYHEGKTVARTNGGSSILAVEEDGTHTFLVIRSFLDDQLCVKEDYEIPYSGELNAVFWGGTKISDDAFCTAVAGILRDFRPDRQYETEGMFMLTDGQQMKGVSYCYEDCPAGIDREDSYMGLLDGTWVFARGAANGQREHGEAFLYDVYPIPEEQTAVIRPYLP